MDQLTRDLSYAVRLLLKSPGFAVASILTLALGIGANIAMFSVVYGVLLRPLPYREADRLLLIHREVDYRGAHRPVPLSIQSSEFDAWQGPLDAIEAPAFYAAEVYALSADSGSELLNSAVVSPTFFSTLGGPFDAGRPLTPDDDLWPATVISDRLARRLFHDPADALGQSLTLTSRRYTVVGVTAPAFQFPSAKIDVWLPAGFARSANPRCCGFQLVARLPPAGTIARAQATASSIFLRSADTLHVQPSQIRTGVVRLRDELVASVRPALLVLFASVLMVLAIACGNLVNLLLARNSARQREFAIRRALGASRGRLVRQLLAESAVLAAAGTLGGVLLARPSLIALSRLAGDAVPRADAIRIDWAVLLFAAIVAALAAFATGLLPALRAAAASTRTAGGSNGTAPAGAHRLQRTMCVVQVALAVTLLVGASLLGRSLVRLLDVDLGVSTDHVLTASMNLAFGRRPTDAQTIAGVGRIVDIVRALPGVEAAGVGTSLPPDVSSMRVTLRGDGDEVGYQAAAVPVTPAYFSALRMRLLKGRFFTDADDDQHPPVMIMTEEAAARFFGPRDPIGRTMALPLLRDGQNTSITMTLVGVVSNVHYAGLAVPPDDAVFRPFVQQPWVAPSLVIRTAGDPVELAPAVRRAIAAVDPAIIVSSVISLDQRVADATAQPHFRAVLLGALAGLALALAAVGLYGVVAYSVSQRTKEIGIRIALGASSGDVLGAVIGDGMLVALAGIGVGLACAWALARLLTQLLFGISPTDPVSFLAVSCGLLVLTLIATYIPARRAARLDPVRAIAQE